MMFCIGHIPDGKNFAYAAKNKGKRFVVRNGVRDNKLYDKIYGLIYSPDSKVFAFKAKKDGKSIIVKETCNC